MKKEITISYEELKLSDLTKEEQELVETAKVATNNSYANYSNFHVGAAIRLSDGTILKGANQENPAFTVGLCAERTAVYAAQAQHPELAITAIAIAARNEYGFLRTPISPCGSCRQVLLEMEDRYNLQMEVLLCGTEKIYRVNSIRDLLPFHFTDLDLHAK